MIRPRKMKCIELTVLDRDVNAVIEFLGHRSLIQFSDVAEYEANPASGEQSRQTASPRGGSLQGQRDGEYGLQMQQRQSERSSQRQGQAGRGPQDGQRSGGNGSGIQERLEQIKVSAAYLGLELPIEPYETSRLPTVEDDKRSETICSSVIALRDYERDERNELQRLENALNEAKTFASLNAPFSELDQLSYLTLRVGRLDPKGQDDLKQSLPDRVAIIPLDDERILAASSRRGRFALDTELKKRSFVPIAIPKDYKGIPSELLVGIEARLEKTKTDIRGLEEAKTKLFNEYSFPLLSLAASYIMADMTEKIKEKLVTTKNTYMLAGWVPVDSLAVFASDLIKLTKGRIGIRTLEPNEVPSVRSGAEKVPTSLSHGRFVSAFEPLVFSYGAPLYGSIDPTPFVAVFFTLLFGIMFGDVGQGLVLLLLGIFLKKNKGKFLSSYKNFAGPLVAVGIFSMFMGLLYGGVFSNEKLLEAPTFALTGFLASTKPGIFFHFHATRHILELMPEKGSLDKLFYFFGFTLALGVILNSAGLVFNIINKFTTKNYEAAIFSKTGIAGVFFFWWVIGIVIRAILGGGLYWFDAVAVGLPLLLIFFGPVLWRIVSKQRPFVKEGFLIFVMESIVEILETLSSYISNSVSFLRVGAFALSHTVLSFITFKMADLVGSGSAFGPVFSLLVIIFGNLIIIVLEGMIVAIQVTRLQYYEFFSKFFTETGVRFSPFRFRKGNK